MASVDKNTGLFLLSRYFRRGQLRRDCCSDDAILDDSMIQDSVTEKLSILGSKNNSLIVELGVKSTTSNRF